MASASAGSASRASDPRLTSASATTGAALGNCLSPSIISDIATCPVCTLKLNAANCSSCSIAVAISGLSLRKAGFKTSRNLRACDRKSSRLLLVATSVKAATVSSKAAPRRATVNAAPSP